MNPRIIWEERGTLVENEYLDKCQGFSMYQQNMKKKVTVLEDKIP